MHLTPFVTLFAVLSLSSVSIAGSDPNVIRVPLERKSFFTQNDPRNLATRTNAAGRVGNFLKNHVAAIAMKYHNTLAAYESNTGSPHPLAQGFPTFSGGGITQPSAGKPRKRWQKRDPNPPSIALDNPTRIKRDMSLSEVNSNMWMCTLSVGTPPQNFTVDFDTGSSDLILPDENCDNSCGGHARYDSADSSTFVNLNKTFALHYQGGSGVNGTQYADNVYMSGYEAVNQTFGAATTYSAGMKFPTFQPDGLLGMAFPQISTLGASPVFQTMVSNGVVPQAVFGFTLSSESGKSELTIGGTNTNMYQPSTVEYVNVFPPAYWQIRLAGLSRPGLNNAPDVVVVNKTSYAQAIIDSGTTLIMTSDSNAQAYYANITGAKPSTDIGGGVWTVPCDSIGSLAPTLTFGSRSFTVSPSTFNLGPVSAGSTDCIAGLAGGGSAWWIIGDVFLQNVYTILDVNNTRVGFADLA